MINYTHKVGLMSGEVILITENQAEAIKSAIVNGQEWIPIGKELVNSKAIAKIGHHHATSQEKKMTENMIEHNLQMDGRFDLVDAKRKLVESKTIAHSLDRDKNFMDKVKAGDPAALKIYMNMPDEPQNSQSEEEVERGDAAYYIDENGQKMYA
jgi:hypothetical protein